MNREPGVNKVANMTGRPFRPHPKPEPKPARKPGAGFDDGFGRQTGPRHGPITTEKAEELAIEALAFLAGEPERLDRFLGLTGLDHASIRSAATQPGFLAAVLDHVTADEALLLAFAAQAQQPPESIAAARERLAGPSLWSSA